VLRRPHKTMVLLPWERNYDIDISLHVYSCLHCRGGGRCDLWRLQVYNVVPMGTGFDNIKH